MTLLVSAPASSTAPSPVEGTTGEGARAGGVHGPFPQREEDPRPFFPLPFSLQVAGQALLPCPGALAAPVLPSLSPSRPRTGAQGIFLSVAVLLLLLRVVHDSSVVIHESWTAGETRFTPGSLLLVEQQQGPRSRGGGDEQGEIPSENEKIRVRTNGSEKKGRSSVSDPGDAIGNGAGVGGNANGTASTTESARTTSAAAEPPQHRVGTETGR